MRPLRVLGVLFLGCLSGCSADSNGFVNTLVPGTGKLGDGCQKSEDCASTFCVDIGETTGICSTRCASTSDCPSIDNWDCVGTAASNLRVCACKKTSQNEICGDGLDNNCDGKADDCHACNGIQVPNDDPANCGACGNACRAEQSCAAGKCTCPASKPDNCSVCTDTSADLQNCGTCGTACGIDQSCVGGKCECPAGSASAYCPGVGCVDTTTNANHCGACGTACTLSSTCQDGQCVCPTAGETFCDTIGCIDLKTNRAHCGACGTACSADKICGDGQCVCAEGQLLCGTTCIDPKSNVAHCGTCDVACGTTEACVDGECGCTNLGLTVCGNACINLQTNASHCGTCDNACGTNERCAAGACVCDSGLHCNGVCAVVNDSANCGACGTQCGTGQLCSGDACTCQGSNLSICNDACVALQTNAANCGSCGNACKTGQYCSAGTCRCTTSGLTYCDQTAACTSLLTDASNCGTCGNVCRTGEICTAGACKCPTGQTYCETAGACIALTTDAGNCGSCGNACQSTQICQSSTCRCSLSTQKYCASANGCIDIYYDKQNCGDCGKVCPTDQSCNYGTCTCSDTTKSFCTDACYDLKTDENHCGTCTNACSGNQVCTAGKCQCPIPVVGTAVRLTNNSLLNARPSAAWDGTHIGIAYAQAIGTSTTAFEIRFALLNPDGTLVSDTALTGYAATGTTSSASRPKLLWNGTEYALTWLEKQASSKVVFLRLDGTGAKKGDPVVVSATPTSSYDIDGQSLAWSEIDKGYGLAYASRNALTFRRLGADASAPQVPNTLAGAYDGIDHPHQIVANQAGVWGVVGSSDDALMFHQFNVDGSKTLNSAAISMDLAYFYSSWPAMVHDGTTWTYSWIGSSTRDVFINRGTSVNSPRSIITGVSPVVFGNVNLAMTGSVLAVGWLEQPTLSTTSPYRYRLQRFSLPTALASAPVALHAVVDVMPTYNIADKNNVTLVSTSNGLVAIWSDTRWGTARELYAVPIDLQSCP